VPTVNVVVQSDNQMSVRARQVCGMFDCPPTEKQSRRWKAELPIDERPWNVGLIVGSSGSGKTTCAKHLWPDELSERFTWSGNSLIDDFPKDKSVAEITEALSAIGFSTIPAWLRPFSVLSNGEQFRATIARSLIEQTGIVVVDEFTSVVDRQVAKVASHAVQKYVRRTDRQFVAISCHHDVIEWLQPDWIFKPDSCEFDWRCLRRRPAINIEVARIPYDAWRLFAPFHYMSRELTKAARCFGLWADGTLAAFIGVRHQPNATIRNFKAVSRIVTLPDWQGIGLAFDLLKTVASAYTATGYRFRNYPAHPSFIRSHRVSEWRLAVRPGTLTMKTKANKKTGCGAFGGRPCAVFEFIGKPMERSAAMKLIS